MPELPEVETVARQLHRKIRGQNIRRVSIHDYRLNGLNTQQFTGAKISGIRRQGKQVCIELSNGRGFLLIHLRMTGRLIWIPRHGRAIAVEPFLHKFKIAEFHLRAEFHLTKGELIFVDPRRFGTIAFHRTLPKFKYVDPLSKEFTVTRLQELCQGRKQSLKQFLMRQDLIVGIGNIYASEILFRARLNPWTQVSRLNHYMISDLHREIRSVLKSAIKLNGTTFSDFQDSEGSSGGFGRFLKVYDREGRPCRRCGEPIKRSAVGGRSTYYCSRCQPRSARKAAR